MEKDNISELSRRAAADVGQLAREVKDVARKEAVDTGARAVWPAAAVVAGGLLAIVGTGMLLASPALDRGARVRRYALGYLVAGGAGLALGGTTLVKTAKHALPETRQAVRQTVAQVSDELQR